MGTGRPVSRLEQHKTPAPSAEFVVCSSGARPNCTVSGPPRDQLSKGHPSGVVGWSQVGERGEQNGVVGHTQPLARLLRSDPRPGVCLAAQLDATLTPAFVVRLFLPAPLSERLLPAS